MLRFSAMVLRTWFKVRLKSKAGEKMVGSIISSVVADSTPSRGQGLQFGTRVNPKSNIEKGRVSRPQATAGEAEGFGYRGFGLARPSYQKSRDREDCLPY
jgi:hypothetical protein